MNTLNTSRNTTPKVLNSKPFKDHMKSLENEKDHLNLLNYGAGKYWQNVSNHLLDNYSSLRPCIVAYEPFLNLPKCEYNKELKTLITASKGDLEQCGTANTVLCSNVLNVIENEDELLEVIRDCIKSLVIGGRAFFSIYEGNGLGQGKNTRDGYQRNQKSAIYHTFFTVLANELKFSFNRYGNIWVIVKA